MTFIVKNAATLRLADGSSFDLIPGMHDDFPANVKNHWAFAAYAEQVNASSQGDADKKGAATAKKQIKQLQGELNDTQEQLKAQKALLDAKDVTISEQAGEIGLLKTRITELEALAAEGEKKDAKKQPSADS